MRDINMQKTVLPNGLRVITLTRDSEIFTLEVGIRAGSLYEDRDINGISHMVEHMLFKGTLKRTAEELNNDIEKLAGDLDIYTTYHQTVMNASIMKYKAEECISLISDMLMNASFPQKELSLEKKVITEEIKMAADDPEDRSYLGFYKAAFPISYHKYNIAGTASSVRGIKRDMLVDFYSRYYVPSNTVFCIVSSYSHEEVLDIINKALGSWEDRNKPHLPEMERDFVSKKVVSHKKGIGQTHILYGFDIKGLDRREEVALALLNKKIGSGPNSALFKELRDKKGYAYNVYSDMDVENNIKMFYIYSCISPENMKDTLAIIDNIIERFRHGDLAPGDEDIKLIKDIFLTDVTIALESPSHIADYMLDGELNHGDPLEYRNVLSLMDTITSADIRAVIDKALKNPVVHILSPK